MNATLASRAPIYSEVLVECLTRYGTREAFVHGDRRMSYRAVADLTSRVQQVLAAKGVRHSGGVALLSPNTPDAWICQTATFLLGARYTGLHPLGSVADHAFVCEDSEIDVLIVHPRYAATGAAVAALANGVSHVLTLGPSDLGEDLLHLADQVQARPLTPGPAQAEDVAWLAYTGGTTGKPKGVMLSHRAMAQEVQSATSWQVPQAPRYLAAAPITHAGALPIVPVLSRGGTVVLQEGFEPNAYLRAIQDEHVNYGFVVPTMLYSILDHADPSAYDLSSLDTIVYGAAAASPDRLAEAIEALGPVLCQTYGQTESVGMATSLRKDEHDPAGAFGRLTSCGRPVQGVQVEIIGEDGQAVDDGGIGELCLRSQVVMSGYWKQPELTAEAFRGGWLRTGDMAVRDDEGYLRLVDRRKDIIITGGFNVYPREIEDVIAQDADVAAVAVIGLPDERWGEAVAAFIVSRPGGRPDAAALTAKVREAKGPHQAPKSVQVVDALPVTAVGKIDKKALRSRFGGTVAPATAEVTAATESR